jgi:hypothetical protein
MVAWFLCKTNRKRMTEKDSKKYLTDFSKLFTIGVTGMALNVFQGDKGIPGKKWISMSRSVDQ